jgi:hypothetical protein
MLKTVGFSSTRTGDQTIVNGNLVIGTAGKGIDFSADPSAPGMTSELLDDYEEGNWTPEIDSQTAGTGRATTVYSAKYTKIGNIVYFTCYAGLTTLGSGGSGNWVINGLPFTSSGSSVFSPISVGFASDLNANVVYLSGYVQVSSTQIRLTGLAAAGINIDQLSFATYVKATTSVIISGSYVAA